jgi:hypothetical protein
VRYCVRYWAVLGGTVRRVTRSTATHRRWTKRSLTAQRAASKSFWFSLTSAAPTHCCTPHGISAMQRAARNTRHATRSVHHTPRTLLCRYTYHSVGPSTELTAVALPSAVPLAQALHHSVPATSIDATSAPSHAPHTSTGRRLSWAPSTPRPTPPRPALPSPACLIVGPTQKQLFWCCRAHALEYPRHPIPTPCAEGRLRGRNASRRGRCGDNIRVCLVGLSLPPQPDVDPPVCLPRPPRPSRPPSAHSCAAPRMQQGAGVPRHGTRAATACKHEWRSRRGCAEIHCGHGLFTLCALYATSTLRLYVTCTSTLRGVVRHVYAARRTPRVRVVRHVYAARRTLFALCLSVCAHRNRPHAGRPGRGVLSGKRGLRRVVDGTPYK